MPLAAELENVRAAVPGQEVGRGIEHLAGVVEDDAGDGEGEGGGPEAEAIGVHGFEVLERLGLGGGAGEEGGEREYGKLRSRHVHIHDG